jgi:cytochrome b561
MPPPTRRNVVRERLAYYLTGVAIGLMLLAFARMAWKARQQQQQPQAPQPAQTTPAPR